jgi:hypothetical protein
LVIIGGFVKNINRRLLQWSLVTLSDLQVIVSEYDGDIILLGCQVAIRDRAL